MPLEWKTAFMSAFAQFPRTHFFIRYVGTDLDASKPSNVHLLKWLPQVDLLHNKKTRALITHGGFNSLQEALYADTPLLAIPLFGDQFRNAHIVEKHDLGLVLRKHQINAEALTAALRELLTNDRYSRAVNRMLRMVLKKPVSPEHSLVKWTEFLAEFQNLDNLRPVGAELGWITYYNMDVYALILAVAVLLSLAAFYSTRCVLKKIARALGLCSCSNDSSNSKNKKNKDD